MRINVTQEHIDRAIENRTLGAEMCHFCPIALALRDVGFKSIKVLGNGEVELLGAVSLRLSLAARRFIENFDSSDRRAAPFVFCFPWEPE